MVKRRKVDPDVADDVRDWREDSRTLIYRRPLECDLGPGCDMVLRDDAITAEDVDRAREWWNRHAPERARDYFTPEPER